MNWTPKSLHLNDNSILELGVGEDIVSIFDALWTLYGSDFDHGRMVRHEFTRDNGTRLEITADPSSGRVTISKAD